MGFPLAANTGKGGASRRSVGDLGLNPGSVTLCHVALAKSPPWGPCVCGYKWLRCPCGVASQEGRGPGVALTHYPCHLGQSPGQSTLSGTFIIPIWQMSKTKAQRDQSQEWAGCRGSRGNQLGERTGTRVGQVESDRERGMMQTEIRKGDGDRDRQTDRDRCQTEQQRVGTREQMPEISSSNPLISHLEKPRPGGGEPWVSTRPHGMS